MAFRNQIHMTGHGSGESRVAVCVLAMVLLTFGSFGWAQEDTPPRSDRDRSASLGNQIIQFIGEDNAALRDSLRQEIQSYAEAIAGLRDSLALDQFDVPLSEEQREQVEETIADLTEVVDDIGRELGEMELEISNNRISFVDEEGEGIVIDVPENLDEHLSQGFELLQDVILNEFPADTRRQVRKSWTWGVPGSEEEAPERHIERGNVVKIQEDVQVPANQDVRGNVVVVFGDAQISGRVDGDVVTVFGNLVVDSQAEVTGQVVTLGGHLDAHPEAEMADVVNVNPLPALSNRDFSWLRGGGLLGLMMELGEFLLILVMALVILALTPRVNLDRVQGTLAERPWPSLLVGLVGSFALLMLGLALIGILVLTVIGIPVALLVLVAMLLLSILSVALVGMALGRRFCQMLSGTCGNDWLMLALGILLIGIVSLVGNLLGLADGLSPVAEILILVGAAIKLTAFLFGIGALLLGRLGLAR